jgi:hypothetical protein
MIVERPRQIRGSRAFIVRVRHNQQSVRFVTFVRQGKRLRLLRCGHQCQQKESTSQTDCPTQLFHSIFPGAL